MKLVFGRNSFVLNDSHLDLLNQVGANVIDAKGSIEILEEYDKGVKEGYVLVVKPGSFEGEWNSLPIDSLLKLKNLKGIVLGTTSYSWVDYKALRDNGIDVMNTPGKSTNAVAEYNIFCMYALNRRYPLILQGVETGLLEEVNGKVAGIVGLGAIGNRTAELCEAQGMRVSFYNRSKKETSWTQMELEELLSESDVIFITIAGNPEVHNLLTKDLLSKMKPTSLFISISPHKVYDLDYLKDAVVENKIGGLAYEDDDVKISDLKGNIFVTPEIAYYTKQTLKNEADIAIGTALEYLKGNKINLVN